MRSLFWSTAIVALLSTSTGVHAACCYFSAKNADILQPAQKVFITWDPDEKVETFTVQPKFEGNALDFGMVIPTPTQPKLHEMPRDFFKHLAIYTHHEAARNCRTRSCCRSLSRMTFAASFGRPARQMAEAQAAGKPGDSGRSANPRSRFSKPAWSARSITRSSRRAGPTISSNGSRTTSTATPAMKRRCNIYIQKKWLFTVMKIDTMQMKRNKDGTFDGEVTPTRFRFTSEKLVYPLKITQISVREKTEALFYVQAPFKVDLPGDMTLSVHLGADAARRRSAARRRHPGRRPGLARGVQGPDAGIGCAGRGTEFQTSSPGSDRSRTTRGTSRRRWNGPAS